MFLVLLYFHTKGVSMGSLSIGYVLLGPESDILAVSPCLLGFFNPRLGYSIGSEFCSAFTFTVILGKQIVKRVLSNPLAISFGRKVAPKDVFRVQWFTVIEKNRILSRVSVSHASFLRIFSGSVSYLAQGHTPAVYSD